MTSRRISRIQARLGHVLSPPRARLCATGFLLSGMVTALAMTLPAPVRTAPPAVTPEHSATEPASVAAGLLRNTIEVRRGDTASGLIRALGIRDDALQRFLTLDPAASALVRRLQPGMIVESGIEPEGRLAWLDFRMQGSDRGKRIARDEAAGFTLQDYALELETREHVVQGTISRSLFADTGAQGLPDVLAAEMAEIFASRLDFNADLRPGARFFVVYEAHYHEGALHRTGRIRAVELHNEGQRHSAYWFDKGQGRGAYYDADGQSLRKRFLRSPLEFTRVSSGFSPNRVHPLWKDQRSHRGTDFAAPAGTRVRASSDGQVEFAGWQRGYGKFIVLRHAGGYTTAYGHLNGFAKGLKKGQLVSQGEVIGFVGTTGWATGPHLHYEFRKGDRHLDPMRAKLPGRPPLSGERLQAFREQTAPLVARLRNEPVQLALADEQAQSVYQ